MSRDAALRALRGVLEGAPHGAAALVGPSGPARGVVLQALVDELGARLPVASMRRPTLPLGGLWMELAARFDLDGGYDAKRRILRLAAELADQGRGLLVVVDGADALPGESLYGLLDVARSERGFFLLLGWPNEGAAQPLPEDLFTATLEGPSPAAAWVPASAPLVEAPRPRIAEPPRGRFGDVMPTARNLDVEPAAARPPAPPASPPSDAARPVPPSFAAPPPLDADAPPLHVRRARRSGLERTAWVASGLAVGLVLGVLLESSGWLGARGGAEKEPGATPDVAAPGDVGAARGDAVYLPASEPPRELAPAPAPKPASERGPQPAAPPPPRAAAAAPPAETAPALRPEDLVPASPPAPAPAPADAAAAPAPGHVAPAPGDVAATPAPDVSAPPPPPPAPAGAPPAEPPDFAAPPPAAPSPAPAPAPSARDVARRSPFDARAPFAEGRLSVRSESPVMIEVDGRPLGPAPIVGIALPRGEHRVIAKYADGSVALKTIYLAYDDVAVSFR
jgi:hypothetical protein